MSRQVIGDWVLGEELGSGEMGVVYRAHHQTEGTEAAVKVLSLTETIAQHLTYEDARERFRREIDTLQKLQPHPNIVGIYDSGEDQDVEFMALEFLDGRSLEQMMEAPLSVEDTCDIGVQLARALDHTHRHGKYHRDVKPANTVYCPGGRVVLLDFGIALDPEKYRLTQAGNFTGSMTFASPQRIQCEDTDPVKDDVFSLGVTMAELLSGRGAFSHSFLKPDRFDSLATLGLPEWLHALLLEMVAYEPEARPDAARVVQRLEEGIALLSSEEGFLPFQEPEEVPPTRITAIEPAEETPAPESVPLQPSARAEEAVQAQPSTSPQEPASSGHIHSPSGPDPVAQEQAALPAAEAITAPLPTPPSQESAEAAQDSAPISEDSSEEPHRRGGWLWLGGGIAAAAALLLVGIVALLMMQGRSDLDERERGLVSTPEAPEAPEEPEAPEVPEVPHPEEPGEDEPTADPEPPPPDEEDGGSTGSTPPPGGTGSTGGSGSTTTTPVVPPGGGSAVPVTSNDPPPADACPPGDPDCLLSSAEAIADATDQELMAGLAANEKQEEIMVTDPDNRARFVGLLANISTCDEFRTALSQTHEEDLPEVTAAKATWCAQCLSETPIQVDDRRKCRTYGDGYRKTSMGCVHPNLQYCDRQYLQGGR